MNILIACEESQAIANQFRLLGDRAFSCDLLPCSGGHPEYHIQSDVTDILQGKQWFRTADGIRHIAGTWDLIICHPECTYLTVTGNRWFDIERYGDKARERYSLREKAVEFFMMCVNAPSEHVLIENPVGYMNTHYRKPDQIINPYQFGDPYEKKTCLWLKNLPLLEPTEIVKPEPRVYYDSGKSHPAWYAKAFNLSPDERKKVRSRTFPGIAKAIAMQYHAFLTGGKP